MENQVKSVELLVKLTIIGELSANKLASPWTIVFLLRALTPQEPSGTVKNCQEPAGTIRNHQKPAGTVRNHQEPSGTVRNGFFALTMQQPGKDEAVVTGVKGIPAT